MSTSIGKVQVDFVANMGSFLKGVKDAQLAIGAFGVKLDLSLGKNLAQARAVVGKTVSSIFSLRTALLGAAVAYGAFRAASSLDDAADKVDNLGKAAKRLGVSAEQLSALRFAAGESGIEFESLANMAAKAAKNVATMVSQGNTTARLGDLTVQLTDATGQVRSLSELLPDLARGIESAGSEADQLRLAQRFFGKGGGDQFVTLLKESGTFVKGLADQTARAHALGVVFTEDQVTKLTAYRDAVGRVQEAWLGVRARVMTQVAPDLTRVIDDLALRIAGMPTLVDALRNTFAIAGDGGSQAAAAGKAIDRLTGAAVNLLTTAASESALLFVRTVANGLGTVGATMAVEFAKRLREILPESLTQAIGLDPRINTAADVQRLMDRREKLLKLAKETERPPRMQFDRRSGEYLEVGGTSAQLQAEVRSVLGHEGSVDQAVAVIDKLIAAQERMLRLNDPGTTAQIGAAVAADGAEKVRATMERSVQAIREAWAQVQTAVTQVEGFATPEFVGPPAPEKQFPAITKAMDGLVTYARETGRLIGEAVGEGFEQVKKHAATITEHTRDVMLQAQEIRFSIYPQERMQAEIDAIRAVRAEVVRLGMESKLTAEDVELAIRQILDANKEPVVRVENLANDMADAIRNFASDAAGAFADFAFGAKVSMGDILKDWGKTLLAMATQALVFKPLFDALGARAGDWLGNTGWGRTSTKGLAAGGSVSGGDWSWVGERGPELVQFGRSGMVYPNGVLPGSGGVTVQVVDQRGSGARPEVSEGQGPDGRRLVRVLIRDEVRGMLGDGSLDRPLASAYGLQRRGTSR